MECICEKLSNKKIDLVPTCLENYWLFSGLKEDELKAVSKLATRKQLLKGNPLFLQGDPAIELFLIKGGRVRLSKTTENGSEVTLDFRKAGDFVGENMLTEDLVYPFSAWCIEDVITCGLSKNQFQDIILKYPKIGLQIIKSMSEKISWLTN